MKFVWNKERINEKNHSIAFCYTINSEKEHRIKIAAGSLYRLFINGAFVGYGPARGPHGYARVDEYVLCEMGKTHITVEVFASNINTFYITDECPFFACELMCGDEVIANSLDFKAYLLNDRVQKVQKHSFQRSFAESYIQKQCRTQFYNGEVSLFPQLDFEEIDSIPLLSRNVSYPKLDCELSRISDFGTIYLDKKLPKFADRSLLEVSEILKGYPYDELQDKISDEVSEFVYQSTGSEGIRLPKTIKNQTYVTFDFKRMITGFFNLKLEITSPCVLYIVYNDILMDGKIDPFRDGCCNVIKYRLACGAYDLINFEANACRYANVIITKGECELTGFKMIKYENPDTGHFTYKVGKKSLDDIIEASKHTFAQNAVDILTDCPSRERAGWLCDSYFSSEAEYLFTGMNKVEKNFLENYILSPQLNYLPEGMIPMCYPADHYDKVYIPTWAMWFVLELNQYRKRTNDVALIEKAKNKVYRLLSFFENYINEDGLLEDLDGWVFIEWSKCNDKEYVKGVNYPSNMLYAAMLEAVAQMYGDQNKSVTAKHIKKMIVKQSFNGEYFEDNRIRENGVLQKTSHITETCQYYAFFFDVANKIEFNDLYHKLMNEFGPKRDVGSTHSHIYPSNAIVGNYLRLILLMQDKNSSKVLEECKDFFTQMVEQTGTLWEHSHLDASLNHGFASIAAKFIVESTQNS